MTEPVQTVSSSFPRLSRYERGLGWDASFLLQEGLVPHLRRPDTLWS